MSQRNIILITLDSVRADHCAIFGYSRDTTPYLSKIAKKSIVCDMALASGVPTFTSLVGIFTGDYSYNDSLAGDLTDAPKWRKEIFSRSFLPEILQKNGYTTIGIHGNPWASRFYGFNRGFSYFNDFFNVNNGSKNNKFSRIHKYLKSNDFINVIKSYINKESMFITWEKMYNNILESVSKAKKPYFLWVLLVDTHLPYLPPKKFRFFSTKSTSLLMFSNWVLRKEWIIRKEPINKLKYKMNLKNKNNVLENLKETIVKAYDDCIRYSDYFIKNLIKDLSNDDPIVIVSADHGEGFGEHGFYYHPPFLYNELIHVPLIIYNSDIKGRLDYAISLLDLPPTILSLANINNNYFPNKSITEYINNQQIRPIISKTIVDSRILLSVVYNEWKLLINNRYNTELYNIKSDPYEQNNILSENIKIASKLFKIAKQEMISTPTQEGKSNIQHHVRKLIKRGVKI